MTLKRAGTYGSRKQLEAELSAQMERVAGNPGDEAAARVLSTLYVRRAEAAQAEGARADALAAWEALARFSQGRQWREQELSAWKSLVALEPRSEALVRIAELLRARRRQRGVALGLALASALLLVLALPPLDVWPLAGVALMPLLWAVRTSPPGLAVAVAGLCGLLVNRVGFGWGVGLMERFGHVAPGVGGLVLLFLCAYQGSVFVLWAVGSHALSRRWGVPWLVSAPLAVALAEHLLPFLFPWNLGLVAWRAWPLTQVAELGGAPAVSSLVVLLNVALLEACEARRERRPWPRRLKVSAGVVLGILGVGLLRVAHIAWARTQATKVRVGLVQPNLGILTAEARKLQGEQHLAVLRQATGKLAEQGVSLVVWPESAFPFLFDRQLSREYAPGHPWELRPGFNGTLLFGALSHAFGGGRVYNSAVMVTPDGRIAGLTDKRQLFPFGEYVPFAEAFPDWARRVRARLPDSPDIAPGEAPRLLQSGALRIAPLLCYEDLLPEAVFPLARRGPNLLVTLANHSWFSGGSAPEQALALATLRSVETRRELIRAASTGVSSMGDALGRVTARSSLTDGPSAPEVVEGEVALLEVFALGPYVAPFFPWACGLALVGVTVTRRRTRASA